MKTEVSIVIPVWNEDEENIKELHQRLTNTLIGLERSYEIVFVDDGSEDRTFDVLQSLHQIDRQIKIVRLARNFGQSAAFLAGFEYTKGEVVVTIDSDLQCAPEDIPRLIDKIDKGYDMVSGWRVKRCDPIFTRKIPAFFMNKIMSARTGITLHDWGCSFYAGRKNEVSQLKIYGRNSRFIKPILAKISKSIIEIKVKHQYRKRGKSKYSIFLLLKRGLDFLLHYSLRPIKIDRPLFTVNEVIERK